MSYYYPYPCKTHIKVQLEGEPVLGYYILQAAWENIQARKAIGTTQLNRYYCEGVGYHLAKRMEATKIVLVVHSSSEAPIDPREPYGDFMISGRFIGDEHSTTILEKATEVFEKDILSRIETLRLVEPPQLEYAVCDYHHYIESGRDTLVIATPTDDGKWECEYDGELPHERVALRLIDSLFPYLSSS